MEDNFLELAFKNAIYNGNYEVIKTMLNEFITLLTGKPSTDFLDMKEEDQLKILDKKVVAGKVYEIFSTFLTACLNKKIQTESALNALKAESKGEENGNGKLS